VSIVNYRTREIILKIAYAGPAMSGKTTSMRAIHGMMSDGLRTEMHAVDTGGDRTLFFDYHAAEIPPVCGFRVKIMTYGVPGQPMYKTTSRSVIMGADAVIFVADSCVGRMDDNAASMAETLGLMAELGIAAAPVILQLNKRDLSPKTPADAMLDVLCKGNVVACCESIAIESRGVAKPFRSACAAAVKRITDALESNFGG